MTMTGAEKQRRWRARHPEKVKARTKAYYAANKQKEKLRHAEWVAANMERLREYGRRRYANNPHPKILSSSRRRAVEGTFTAEDILAIREAQRSKCAYCRARLTRKIEEIDHIIPISCGGTNFKENIQLLCRACNRSKGARDPIIHAQSLGKLI